MDDDNILKQLEAVEVVKVYEYITTFTTNAVCIDGVW